ncbi:3-carboxymuconate cyclase [Trichoderma arundinaceum]|uniref:3-carboxymuconate cyclase n=1 Tax=Trichoderma arundinaceum TaxID=490622 RepID=A0A395NIK0_TRIAR|nr:3-carboxymuconate cyclase [Trichoderma arundinaceum]
MHFIFMRQLLYLLVATPFAVAFKRHDRVLYLQDNDARGNNIISVKVSGVDGTLSAATRTSTGGSGISQLVAVSQDSVTVSGNYLFTVNAGDNTLSAFIINPRDPLHPRLLGSPAATLGHAPVSVAYSDKLNIACVVNGGSDLAGVTCFSVHPDHGLTRLGPMRPIVQSGHPMTEPQTPPVILTGDIVFNPSSTALFISVAAPNGGSGSVVAYPVTHGQVSYVPVNSTLKDLDLILSLNFLESDSRLFATNPHNNSPGASILQVSPTFEATEAEIITIPNQVASCWVANAAKFNKLFVMDVAISNITIVDSRNGYVESQFTFDTPAFGATDSIVDQRFLYTVTLPVNNNFTYIASPKILVYDIIPVLRKQNPRQIQQFDIFDAVGHVPSLMGLAVYPAKR